MANNKFRRIASLVLVCLMLTPLVSWAVEGDNNTTDATKDAQNTNNNAVVADTTEPMLTDAERKQQALEDAVVEDIADIPANYKLVAHTDEIQMFLDESNLSVIIRNSKTGAIMKSTISEETATARNYSKEVTPLLTNGVSVRTVFSKEKDRFSAAADGPLVGASSADSLKVTINDNGFTAHIVVKMNVSGTDYSVELDVVVTLDNEGMHVEIPENSVVEMDDSVLALSYVYLYPLMGYTELGDRDGYMVLPDGNGITVDYTNNFYDNTYTSAKYLSEFKQIIYGDDLTNSTTVNAGLISDFYMGYNEAEVVSLPYYGMVHEDTDFAMLAYIEEGATNSTIIGNFNGVNNYRENFVYCKFVYRDRFTEPTNNTDTGKLFVIADESYMKKIKVTFLFTSGEDADYTGLAVKLRDKLIKDGTLAKKDTAFNINLDFFGVDNENFLIFTKSVAMTTVEDLKNIIKDLEDEGVTNILAKYNGWQDGGTNDIPVDEYDVDSSLGSDKELVKLVDELEGTGVELYLEHDAMEANADTSNTTFNSVKGFDGLKFSFNTSYNEVYHEYKLLDPEKAYEYVKELAEDMMDNNIGNLSLTAIGNYLFSYTMNSVQYMRYQTMEKFIEIFDDISDTMDSLILDRPFDKYWKYTDAYTSTPTSSSMYIYTTNEVPILTTVLKGVMPMYSTYINFEANQKENLLNLIEYGVYPTFLLTKESPALLKNTDSNWIYSSEYDLYKEQVVEYYNKLKGVNDTIGEDSKVVDHKIYDNEIHMTQYDNGVKVYVNYAEETQTIDDVTVEALSYKIVGGAN